MKKLALCTALFAASVSACASEEAIDTSDINLESELGASKEDRVGNRFVNQFGGVLDFDMGTQHFGQVARPFYTVGFTFRADAGKDFKLWARGADDAGMDTTLRLYGPKSSTGSFTYLRYNDDYGGNLSSQINFKTTRAGIYLAVLSGFDAGRAEIGLNCGSPTGCDLPCAVIRLYAPVCGEDGVTYSNPQSAACFAVPVAHTGTCEPAAPSCDDITCEPGTHCELQQVVCVRWPCYPIPTCVPDPAINACSRVRCASGTHCVANGNSASCEPDVNPCALVRCAAGTECVASGTTAQCLPTCRKGGCSGQVCSDRDVITTCEWRPEYACYQSATCARQADGACGWTQTPDLNACLGR